MVKQARASKNAQNKFTDKRIITNLSLFRQGLLPQPLRSKKPAEIRKQLELQQAVSNAKHAKSMEKVKKLLENMREEINTGVMQY